MMLDPLYAEEEKVQRFRELHESGCFVIPNPWDRGTAMYLHRIGYQALATTSAGLAFSQGLPDTPTAIARDDMLAHLREIAAATPLPVNADFQNGYAHAAEDVAENVALCVQTGISGLSIEDATGQREAPLYEKSLAVERIRAARAAIDRINPNIVLTARCEAYLVGDPDPLQTSLDRLQAYSEAGANCLYAPGIRDLNQVREIVKSSAPKPINILVSANMPGFSVESLSHLGVRRISVGSAMSRVAWGAFIKASKEIIDHGSFNTFDDAFSYGELNGYFDRPQNKP